jgi:hypothetical protein
MPRSVDMPEHAWGFEMCLRDLGVYGNGLQVFGNRTVASCPLGEFLDSGKLL